MLRFIVALLAFAILAGAPAAAQTGPNAFTFVALGDMPYRDADIAKVDRLIAAINKLKPAFSIHVGDIKSGSSPCGDADLKRSLDQVNTLEQPVVYSIGDNEWTDCHRDSAGKFDPRERLAKVRELAFSVPGKTLGKSPMQVESQAKLMPKFAKFVENQRFTKNGVVFIVPHVVGSNNGFETQDPQAAVEFFERNAANIAWIEDGFRLAKETGAKAVVIAFQANVYDLRQSYPAMPPASGFVGTVQAISRGARAFGKPVLVVHGDNHVLELESFKDTVMRPVPNTFRLQLPGDNLVHAMRIVVDPDLPGVFSFVPLIVPENGPF
jgi:molybdopterin-guanine dinucleotide biosynthesis protein A